MDMDPFCIDRYNFVVCIEKMKIVTCSFCTSFTFTISLKSFMYIYVSKDIMNLIGSFIRFEFT